MGIKKTLTPVRELHRNTSAYADKTVTVGGWIRNMRASNAFGFIDLNDGTFFKSPASSLSLRVQNSLLN